MQVLTEEFADSNPGVEFHVAGSWRRGAPVIGDLDLLVVCGYPITPNLFEPGVQLPSVVDWQRAGPRIANGDLRLPDGSSMHVDVWHSPPENRGAMLLFSTGPMPLNTYMRSRAKRSGMALSQNCLTNRETCERIGGTIDQTERFLFEALGMRYETPQERQRWASAHP